MKRESKTRRRPLLNIRKVRIGLSLMWVLVLSLLMLAGCTQTDVEEDVIPPHALKDVDAGFSLNVLANQPPVTRSITFTPAGTIESDTLATEVKESVQTKASASLSEAQESQIASLWVGQYDATTGTRLFNQYISSMTGDTVNLKLKQSQTGSRSRVYFVSNAGDLGAIADETTLKQHTLAYESTNAGLPADYLCKMMGMWEGEVVVGGMKDITVSLTRLLARITFSYSVGTDFAFTPTSVVLKNAPTLSQVAASTAQLTTEGIRYKDYTEAAGDIGTDFYWYLPENMAGTVVGANEVDAEKKKIGTGVSNATCIELTGNAEQGGVTYTDVTFRFYPGSNYNNYDIVRNSHYAMDVTLIGIDVSDERITVGEIPPIEVDPEAMPAKKGGEKEIQITARPGQPWEFNMPLWLSALLDSQNIRPGATITHQGPVALVFKAVDANPKAEERSVSFNVDVNGTDQEIKITQSGSTLIKGSDISLTALADAEGSSSFTATEGLQWFAVLSDGDGWLSWSATNPGISGIEAPAGAQTLKVKTTAVNPSGQVRRGKIVVKAGASVGDVAYTGLKQEIAVNQQAATLTVSAAKTIAATASTGNTSTFTATPGLSWDAGVVSTGSWLSLTGTTSGINNTTGAAQTITYNAAINPNASTRQGTITIKAGNAVSGTDAGLTKTIAVTQSASSLSASINPTTALAATAGAGGTYTLNGTSGLSYSFTAGFPSWLTVTNGTASTGGGMTSGSAQQLTYKTSSVNPNGTERKATVTVKAGNMTKDVEIKQAASSFSRTNPSGQIAVAANSTVTGSVTATAGLAWTITPASNNNITVSPTSGTGNATITFTGAVNSTGVERTGSFTLSATGASPARTLALSVTQVAGEPAIVGNLQVCKTDGGESMYWSSVNSYCSNLTAEGKSDWYLPSKDQLLTIYNNKSSLQSTAGFRSFVNGWYWSSTLYRSDNHWIVHFDNGKTDSLYDINYCFVRCVRDK